MSIVAINYRFTPKTELKAGAYSRIERAVAETGTLNCDELLETILDDLCHDFESPAKLNEQKTKLGFETTRDILNCIDEYVIRNASKEVLTVRERKHN